MAKEVCAELMNVCVNSGLKYFHPTEIDQPLDVFSQIRRRLSSEDISRQALLT